MLKILSGKNKIVYHLAFWLVAYVCWVFIFRNGTLVLTRSITIQFCYLLFIAGNYYFNLFFNIPRYLNRKKYVLFGLYFIAGVALASALRVPVSVFVSKYLFHISAPPPGFLYVFYNSFVNILFWLVIILAGHMIIERIQSQLYIEQIIKEKAANELNFLRAQFNPHFLFNSINSIYGHIDKSNKEARDMLLVFSEMLRYQLYECNVEQIALEREVNYLKNYIAMQKSRMNEHIAVDFCTSGVNGQVKVAPLVFITFVENAFKYVGYNEGKPNMVHIDLAYQNAQLTFRVFNTKDSFIRTPEGSSGLGIANTQRRLELVYPGRHFLKINNGEEDFEVILTLYNL
jgi:hypothetical protein